MRQTLPDGFQRAEFLLEHGAIDMIVDRREMRDKLANLCTLLMRMAAPVAQQAVAPIREAGVEGD